LNLENGCVHCNRFSDFTADAMRLLFLNERIVSSLSIFSAPEDTISGATPTFMVCLFAI